MSTNENSLGKPQRLRILVESLVRAGLLGIPVFGSALEKLAFGAKDAIATAEMRLLLESIEQRLRSDQCTTTLTEVDVARIADSIMAKPELDRLSKIVDSTSGDIIPLLTDVLLEVARYSSVAGAQSAVAKQTLDALVQSQNDLARTVQESAERNRLLLEEFIAQATRFPESKERSPLELLAVLQRPRVREMFENARHVYRGARWFDVRSKAMIAVDISEIINYIVGPSTTGLYLEDVVLFEHGPGPIYVLPETMSEFQHWMEIVSTRLFLSAGELAAGRLPRALAIGEPLQIRRALKVMKQVVGWPDELLKAESAGLAEAAFSELAKSQPPRRGNARSELQCARIVGHLVNARSILPADEVPVFISRDRRLISLETSLFKRNARFDVPVLAHPIEWAYHVYWCARSSSGNCGAVSPLRSADELSSLLEQVIAALRNPSPDTIMSIAPALVHFAPSLFPYGKQFNDVARWMTSDVAREDTLLSQIEQDRGAGLIESHAQAVVALREVNAQVQRLARAYEPFAPSV